MSANVNESTASYAGRSPLSHSEGVDYNMFVKSRATSEGFGSFIENVRESPTPIVKQMAPGRDVFDGVIVIVPLAGRATCSSQETTTLSETLQMWIYDRYQSMLSRFSRIFKIIFKILFNTRCTTKKGILIVLATPKRATWYMVMKQKQEKYSQGVPIEYEHILLLLLLLLLRKFARIYIK